MFFFFGKIGNCRYLPEYSELVGNPGGKGVPFRRINLSEEARRPIGGLTRSSMCDGRWAV